MIKVMDIKLIKKHRKKARPLLLCLLPVRNGAPLLPDYLENAKLFADVVVALDDGSTDRTPEILKAAPIVKRLLTNPRREGYLGWDNNQNINRLLAAAEEFNPHWILQFDIDERLDPSEAEALIDFLKNHAQPGYGYGLECYRLNGDETYDPVIGPTWRLFAYEKGQRFEDVRLFGNQLPTNIPWDRWVMTSLRIKHYEANDEGHARRLAKYREADPQGSFASWYENLPKTSPRPHPKWQRRKPHQPYIIGRLQLQRAPVFSPERLAALREELAASAPQTSFRREVVADLLVALDLEKNLSADLARALYAASPTPHGPSEALRSGG